ncbi:MAG: hypothetical protein KA369_10685 [Spirochaetes bacterium]|nr:hypothetical protein [Spirochaetota bacterium]
MILSNLKLRRGIVITLSFLAFLCMISTAAISRDNESNEPDSDPSLETTAGGDDREDVKQDNKPKIFGFDMGISGGYSKGASVSNFMYKPYGNIHLKHEYVKFTAGMARCQNYLVTDGEGKFENINFTQPKAALSIYPHKVVELYGEYRYSTGDYSHYYRGHEGTAGFLLDFDKVIIDVSLNKRTTEYRFKSINWAQKITFLYSDINSQSQTNQYYIIDLNDMKYLDDISTTINVTWNVTDTTGIDATYFYLYSMFKYPRDSYYIHTPRIGAYSEVWKYLSLHGGVSLGIDSEKYLIAGGDIGVTFNILGYVTLSASYLPSYYLAPKSNSALQQFMELYVLYVYNYNISANPYLQSSLVGKSFFNQGVSFNVNYRY